MIWTVLCCPYLWPLFFLFAIWLVKEMAMGICICKTTLEGKVVLVTGGNSGLGYETCLELARRGAEVVIASRNEKKVGR